MRESGLRREHVRRAVVRNGIPVSTITPSDSAIYDMAREGKSAQEILAFIRASARRRFDRHLANALMNLGVKSTIKLDMFSGWKISQALPGKRYAAAYSPKTDTVAIFTPRGATQSILHELVHAATLKALANPRSRAAIEMRRLFKHVQDSGQADGMYGMLNVDEFVAEAFSNPKFQQALMSIPAPSGSSLKSAWEWFVGMVARIIGLRRPAQATALDRAMVLGAELMRDNAAIAGNVSGNVSGNISEEFSPDNPDIRFNAAHDWISDNSPKSVRSVVANAMHSDKATSWITPCCECRL